MSTEKNKWIDAVGKLLELTQEGQVIWESHEPPIYLNNQSDKRVDVVYQTHYKDRVLRLYQLHYKVEKDMLSLAQAFYPREEYPYWTKTTILELLDQNGLSAWIFPKIEALDHLLAAVQYQVVGVREFLDEILTEA